MECYLLYVCVQKEYRAVGSQQGLLPEQQHASSVEV